MIAKERERNRRRKVKVEEMTPQTLYKSLGIYIFAYIYKVWMMIHAHYKKECHKYKHGVNLK